jgi:sugar phosphate isomerase/epimerase
MNNKKIGLQLYTLREFLKTPDEIKNTLKKVREIGYEVVQISGIGKIEMKELKEILNSEGLYPCSTHTGYEKIVKEVEKVIEEHKLLGAENVVCPGIPQELHNLEGYKKVANELTKAGEILFKNNLTLSYHNHAREFEKYKGKTGLEILFEESNPDYLKAEIDTYWVQYGGADPAYWIRKMKGRIILVHFKDMIIKENKQIFAEVGEGNLNWKEIIDACKFSGVRWYLVEQDICYQDPFESIKISLQNLNNMGIE